MELYNSWFDRMVEPPENVLADPNLTAKINFKASCYYCLTGDKQILAIQYIAVAPCVFT